MKRMIENKEFWEHQLEKLKTSGLSRSKYCKENGINYDRFGYWIKKLSFQLPRFIPVNMKAPNDSIDHVTLCTIELRDHVIKIHDLSALSFILGRLA